MPRTRPALGYILAVLGLWATILISLFGPADRADPVAAAAQVACAR